MARNPPILGRHTALRLSLDGKPVKAYTVRAFTYEEDAVLDASQFLGEPAKTSYREHNGWMGTFEWEVASKDFHDVEDQVIGRDRARLPPTNVSLLYVETYRDGTTASWSFLSVSMKFGANVSSRQDKVVVKVDWRSDLRVPNQ